MNLLCHRKPGMIFTAANQDKTVFLDTFLDSWDKKMLCEKDVVIRILIDGNVPK